MLKAIRKVLSEYIKHGLQEHRRYLIFGSKMYCNNLARCNYLDSETENFNESNLFPGHSSYCNDCTNEQVYKTGVCIDAG